MKQVKKILIVDDDHKLRSLLSSYLLSQGFFIHSAGSICSALVIIRQDSPDLIISDVMMKDFNGYDLIKLLKLDSVFMHIPVIFLTAKGMTSDRIKGYNLGCHAYLTKPFNPQELLAIINNIFQRINLSYSNPLSKVETLVKKSSDIIFFTPREKNVLKLVIAGYMNKEIAINLNTSLRNVEKYISRLLDKTNTRNRTELVKMMLSVD